VTRNATLVGSAYADVPAGGSQDALCLVPWTPVCERWPRVPRGGRERSERSAPEPTAGRIRSTNVSASGAVEPDGARGRWSPWPAAIITVTVSGLQRIDKSVIVTTEVGGELDARTLANLGLRGLQPARKKAVEVGLDHHQRCVGEKDPIGKAKLELRVPREPPLPSMRRSGRRISPKTNTN
jgi:hypothetical protein